MKPILLTLCLLGFLVTAQSSRAILFSLPMEHIPEVKDVAGFTSVVPWERCRILSRSDFDRFLSRGKPAEMGLRADLKDEDGKDLTCRGLAFLKDGTRLYWELYNRREIQLRGPRGQFVLLALPAEENDVELQAPPAPRQLAKDRIPAATEIAAIVEDQLGPSCVIMPRPKQSPVLARWLEAGILIRDSAKPAKPAGTFTPLQTLLSSPWSLEGALLTKSGEVFLWETQAEDLLSIQTETKASALLLLEPSDEPAWIDLPRQP